LIELNQSQIKEILSLKEELKKRNQNKIKFEKLKYEEKLIELNTDKHLQICNLTNEIECGKTRLKVTYISFIFIHFS